jgi:hypothetical protein
MGTTIPDPSQGGLLRVETSVQTLKASKEEEFAVGKLQAWFPGAAGKEIWSLTRRTE